ncbi:hypothetical protein [Nonomuraea sp. NPDC005650]|uniref:hypothetical protein n=1 Tax=Nonomuraea sp. NPDC005650 TaxID=3157045 RepID=UPI0033A45117
MSADLRKFKLAHPLREEDAVELGLPERTYQTGEELTLPYAYAMRLFSAGFVEGGEPGRPQTAETALKRVNPPAKPAVVENGEPAPAPVKTKPPVKGE